MVREMEAYKLVKATAWDPNSKVCWLPEVFKDPLSWSQSVQNHKMDVPGMILYNAKPAASGNKLFPLSEAYGNRDPSF